VLVPQFAQDKAPTAPELAPAPLPPFLLAKGAGAGAGVTIGVATGEDDGSFRFKEPFPLTGSISSSVEERAAAAADCKALL
jgi:hypothetical protein